MAVDTEPTPGGRRARRLAARHRARVMRVSAAGAVAVAAFGVGTFAAAAGDDPATPAPATQPADFEAIAPIAAGDADVVVSTEEVEVAIEPEDITREDDWVPEGTTKVASRGKEGLSIVTYRVTTVNGVETERVELATLVVSEPTHDVVLVGTLDIPSQPAVVPGSTRDVGQQLAAERGWTGVEWQCLDNLWQRESNWRTKAENKSSGAYGIPQALPGSKMAKYGSDWKTNPATQIKWGLGYIEGRYDTPCGAWAAFMHRDPHWY